MIRRDKSLPQNVEALRAGIRESALADFHELRQDFSPHRWKAEQRTIVWRLEALSAESKRLEEIYQSKLDALDELKKSVLARAFEGEL